MLSIGWVMFWKAVVVAVWILIVERWASFRKRRRDDGLPLKLNRRTGAYEVRDWTGNVDRSVLFLRNCIYAVGLTLWTALGAGYLYDGRDGMKVVVDWIFSILLS